jgi:hypothetical protein
VDYLAVLDIIVLGIAFVAAVLYLNISDRAAELAVFTAVGWTDRGERAGTVRPGSGT